MVGDGLWDGPTVERSAHSVRTGELDLGDQADNGHFGGFGGDSDDLPAGYKEIHFSDGAVQWAAQKDLTDPSTFDSDGDGLSDGQELGGWDVNVIGEKTKERDSAQSRRVRSDPTIKDTDHDGLDDFNEFQNLGDPLVRDTDGDRILDGDEGIGNLTQIEGSDPTIPVARATFVIEYDAHGLPTGKVTITIHLEARDNVGVEYIEVSPGVTVGDAFRPVGDSQKVFCAAASGAVCTALIADVEFGGDYWALVQGAAAGWDGQASVGDVNGNGVIGTLHADSILQAVARAILGAILALVDAVTKLAASALEWLWESITALFDPLMQVIGEFLQGILQRLVEAVGSATHALPLGLIEQAAPFFEVLERLVIVLGIIGVAVLSISLLAEPFVFVIGALVTALSVFILPLILSAFGQRQGRQAAPAAPGTLSLSSINDAAAALLNPPVYETIARTSSRKYLVQPNASNPFLVLSPLGQIRVLVGVLGAVLGIIVGVRAAIAGTAATKALLQSPVAGVVLGVISLTLLIAGFAVQQTFLGTTESATEAQAKANFLFILSSLFGLLGLVRNIIGFSTTTLKAIGLVLSILGLAIGSLMVLLRWSNQENDFDSDGLSDFQEDLDWTVYVDRDSRGASGEEIPYLTSDAETSGRTGRNDPDSDDDGLLDGRELNYPEFGRSSHAPSVLSSHYVTKATDRDTDDDGLFDGDEQFPEDFEVDGVPNPQNLPTDPTMPDTDMDGIVDGLELKGWAWDSSFSRPVAAQSGGFITDPTDPDSDSDGVPDGQDVDPLHDIVLAVELLEFDALGRLGWRDLDDQDCVVFPPSCTVNPMELRLEVIIDGDSSGVLIPTTSPTAADDTSDLINGGDGHLSHEFDVSDDIADRVVTIVIRVWDEDQLDDDTFDIDPKNSGTDDEWRQLDLNLNIGTGELETGDIERPEGVGEGTADGSDPEEPFPDLAIPFDAALRFEIKLGA